MFREWWLFAWEHLTGNFDITRLFRLAGFSPVVGFEVYFHFEFGASSSASIPMHTGGARILATLPSPAASPFFIAKEKRRPSPSGVFDF